MQYSSWENGHLFYPRPLYRRYRYSFLFFAVDTYFLLQYTLLFVSSLLLPPPSLAAVLYITRILLYLHLNLHILPLLFSRGDLCFVCMNHTDPAQHCTSQKEALGCLANTALVDLHTTPLQEAHRTSTTISVFLLPPSILYFYPQQPSLSLSLSLFLCTYPPVVHLSPFTTQRSSLWPLPQPSPIPQLPPIRGCARAGSAVRKLKRATTSLWAVSACARSGHCGIK